MSAVATKKAEPKPLPGGLEPMLSIDDLMRLLQCSRRVVDRLRAAGKLPRADVMIGRLPRWKTSTIRAWLDAQ